MDIRVSEERMTRSKSPKRYSLNRKTKEKERWVTIVFYGEQKDARMYSLLEIMNALLSVFNVPAAMVRNQIQRMQVYTEHLYFMRTTGWKRPKNQCWTVNTNESYVKLILPLKNPVISIGLKKGGTAVSLDKNEKQNWAHIWCDAKTSQSA